MVLCSYFTRNQRIRYQCGVTRETASGGTYIHKEKNMSWYKWTLCTCILHLKGSQHIKTHLRSRRWGTLQTPALLQVPFFNLLSCPTKSKSLCIQVSPRITDQQSVKHIHVTESVIYGSAQIQWQFIVLRFNDWGNGIKVSTGDSSSRRAFRNKVIYDCPCSFPEKPYQ